MGGETLTIIVLAAVIAISVVWLTSGPSVEGRRRVVSCVAGLSVLTGAAIHQAGAANLLGLLLAPLHEETKRDKEDDHNHSYFNPTLERHARLSKHARIIARGGAAIRTHVNRKPCWTWRSCPERGGL